MTQNPRRLENNSDASACCWSFEHKTSIYWKISSLNFDFVEQSQSVTERQRGERGWILEQKEFIEQKDKNEFFRRTCSNAVYQIRVGV